jgi:thiamine-phosphate pyrophosphorylase
LAALVGEIDVSSDNVTMPSSPPCSLYLITPPLTRANARAFAQALADVLAAAPAASALVRLAPGAEGEAKAIVAPLLKAAVAADCALILENDARLAARLGADGVHVAGAGEALEEALDSLKPERIVGAGALRLRDEAMTAGEKGADYVMFGEPRGVAPAMALELLVERVAWWAEIFETPCVAYAESIEAVGRLARAGADFVALDGAIWNASSPAEAARAAHALLVEDAAEAP